MTRGITGELKLSTTSGENDIASRVFAYGAYLMILNEGAELS